MPSIAIMTTTIRLAVISPFYFISCSYHSTSSVGAEFAIRDFATQHFFSTVAVFIIRRRCSKYYEEQSTMVVEEEILRVKNLQGNALPWVEIQHEEAGMLLETRVVAYCG